MISRVQRYLGSPGLGPALVKAVVGSAGVRIAGMGLTFLLGVQLARGLGAEGYGLYGLAMSFIALAMVPTQFGLPQLVMREVAAAQAAMDWGRLRGISAWARRAVLIISVALVILGVPVFVIAYRYIDPQLMSVLLAGLILLPFVALGNLNGATLRGLHYQVRSLVPDILVRPACFSVFLLSATWLVDLRVTATTAMALGSVSAIISYAASRLLLKQALPPQVLSATPVVTPDRWWGSAFPMALTEAMRVLQAHLVIIVVGLVATTAAVGVYRVAASVSVLVAMPITLLNVACSPLISQLFSQNELPRLQRMLGWASVAMMSGVLALSVPFVLYGEFLLGFMFGSEFKTSYTPLLILCISVLSGAFFGSGASVLNMTGHEKQVTKSAVIALVLLSVVAGPLIARYESEGAAIATLLSMLAWQALMWHDARRLIGLETSALAIFKSK